MAESSAMINQTKDCPYGCKLDNFNKNIVCLDQTRKIGRVQMLVIVTGISCSGLVLVAWLTHWYMRRTKRVTDLVLENMNVVLINEESEKEVESENDKTEADVILADVTENV